VKQKAGFVGFSLRPLRFFFWNFSLRSLRLKALCLARVGAILCATFLLMSSQPPSKPELLYCPKCAVEVSDPLSCGDCGAVICRKCGTPLEAADELGMG
jgi:hypothetical protein